MALKKKSHGKLSLFYGLLFYLSLGLLSINCYATDVNFEASNTLTTDEVSEMLSWFSEHSDFMLHNNKTVLDNFISNVDLNSFTNSLNSNLPSIFVKANLTFFNVSEYDDTFTLSIGINNNTIGNTAPFLRIEQYVTYNFNRISAYYIQENNSSSSSFTMTYYLNSNGTFSLNGKFDSAGNVLGNIYLIKDKVVNSKDLSKTFIPGICTFDMLGGTYYLQDGNRNYYYWVWGDDNNILTPIIEPDEPSGDSPIGDSGLGNITTPSGDSGGSINLQPIQEGIVNIQNQISGDSQKIIDNQNQNTETIVNAISGEVGKINNTLTDDADNTIDNTIITSGDIENALGFEIAQDPYSNFWTTLTNNLKNALLGSKRSIDITFQGRTWTISLDEYMVLPSWLTIILIPISTAFFTWVLARQWKHIFDRFSSGNIDSILKENSEERNF